MTTRAGYSLFEVLIAFAIMAIVLAALLPGQTRLFARASHGDLRLLAADYAQSRLSQIGITEPMVLGESLEDYRTWTVATRIKEGQTGLADDPYHIEVVITAASGQPLARAETLRLVP